METNKALVLWGGTDISSKYYGQKPSIHADRSNFNRDRIEFEKAANAINNNTPIVGVCRGAQLLCIINGGSLYQHSEAEQQDHDIIAKAIGSDDITITLPQVSAAHHQIMRPEGNFEIIGWHPLPVKVFDTDTKWHMEDKTPEIVWWPNTKCLGIQAHPEWAHPESQFLMYTNALLDYLNINCFFDNRSAKHWEF